MFRLIPVPKERFEREAIEDETLRKAARAKELRRIMEINSKLKLLNLCE